MRLLSRVSSLARRVNVLCALFALASVIPVAAGAQELAQAGQRPRFLLAAGGRGEPVEIEAAGVPVLVRRVTLAVENAPIASVLQAITRQTGIRFVYAADTVPADRRLTIKVENITLAAALTEVLLDTGLDVLASTDRRLTLVPRRVTRVALGAISGRVIDARTQTALSGATVVVQGTSHSATTGSDGRYRIAAVAPGTYTVRARYIGYTPGTASVTVSADREVTADLALEKSAQRLDEVVTTGTVVPTEVKALPTPISVVTSEDIERNNLQRVDQVFRGQVPGALAWDQGPFDYYSTIAVRGTTSLSAPSGIKTFIDGVEVANPVFIATIDPNSIDRIEITRGPQGSTLYGAGAIDGVMQIFTKKGQLGLARPEVAGKISAGGIGGFDGKTTTLQTDNAVSIFGAGDRMSYGVGGSYRHLGEWVPSYHSTDWGVWASAQTIQGPLELSSSLRYADKAFDQPWDTRFKAYTLFSQPFYLANRLRQQTYGLTGTLRAAQGWQHTLVLGYDQDYLGVDQTQPSFTTPADSFLSSRSNHEAKISLLYHTDVSFRLASAVGAVVTAGVNYESHDEVDESTSGATRTAGSLDGSTSVIRTPWTNTGYFGQIQINFAERLFLTGGLRAERNENFGPDFGTAWSPRVGAAYVLGLGPATVKLRASYGESIRAPLPGERDAVLNPFSIHLANPNLAPERQRGVDGGVEVYWGRASIAATHYNQRAVNLIDLVTIPTLAGTLPTLQHQNVSRVKNEGWELEAHLPLGAVQLAGTYSMVNSTVQELGSDFPPGGLQVGDRLLGIPHTSAGATVSYSPVPRTTLTARVTHIGHWTNTDDVALYAFYFGDQPYRGTDRAYWIEYPTVTKIGLGLTQELAAGLTVFIRAENVGNNLRFEAANSSIPTPRSVTLGASIRY